MSENGRFARRGLLLPLFLLVVTTVYIAAAFDISAQFTGGGDIGPRTIPILAAVLMYAALLVVIVQELRGADPAESAEAGGSLLRPALVVVATAIYILVFRQLGYTISTLLYVAALFAIFGYETRRPPFFALYTCLVTALFYGLFAGIFGVRLPPIPGMVP